MKTELVKIEKGQTHTVKRAIGLNIAIRDVRKAVDFSRSVDALEQTDIIIEVNGKQTKMTYEEFLKRLGIKDV